MGSSLNCPPAVAVFAAVALVTLPTGSVFTHLITNYFLFLYGVWVVRVVRDVWVVMLVREVKVVWLVMLVRLVRIVKGVELVRVVWLVMLVMLVR